MPVVGKSLNIIEVMAYELYFVQQGASAFCLDATVIVKPVNGSSDLNCFKIENPLQSGTESSCTTYSQAGSRLSYRPIFIANFKIFAIIIIPEISQQNSTDYSSYIYV